MPQNQPPEFFPLYRIVAQFGNGERKTFDGVTFEHARSQMEDYADQIGEDLVWYDGVTDEHYENGLFHAAADQPQPFPFPLMECPDAPDQLTIYDPPDGEE